MKNFRSSDFRGERDKHVAVLFNDTFSSAAVSLLPCWRRAKIPPRYIFTLMLSKQNENLAIKVAFSFITACESSGHLLRLCT